MKNLSVVWPLGSETERHNVGANFTHVSNVTKVAVTVQKKPHLIIYSGYSKKFKVIVA